MLIKGKNLTPEQTEIVLSAFIYRWTTENVHRVRIWENIVGKPAMPLQSDHDWLNEHAFYFVKDDSRLMKNRHYAEPDFMADLSNKKE